jgi:hypothetical protein
MVNVKILQLNNKSRKGTYVYIKGEKKQPSRYYKFDDDTPIDAYVEFYKDRYTKQRKVKGTVYEYKKAYSQTEKPKRKKGVRKSKLMSQADRYKKKISKRPSVQGAIKKGIGEAEILNPHKSENQDIIRAKRKLLEKLVLDDDLLDLVISQENFKKIKSRVEYRVTFKDKEGDIIGTASLFNKNPEEAVERIKKATKIGELMSDDSKSQSMQKLKFHNFVNINIKKSAKLGRAEIKLIFRKGK